MNEGILSVVLENLSFLNTLISDKKFTDQLSTWFIIDGLVFFLLVILPNLGAFTRIKSGMGILNRASHYDDELTPTENYSISIGIISESALLDKIISHWVTLQERLTTLQRSDFFEHINKFTPRSHLRAFGIARFFLLSGLFFTFAALSNTFLAFRGVEQGGHITFVQNNLIPSVGTALTSTLVAILFSLITMVVANILQGYVSKFSDRLEEYLIEYVSPQHPLANAEHNLSSLVSAQKDISNLVQNTINELRNVADITSTAFSDLSGATHKFVQAFDSTQKVIKNVNTNQENIVEQNKRILTAAEALQDRVVGIQRVFELENSAIREVKDAIKGTNEAIDKNATQLNTISTKFSEYNDELATTLKSSTENLTNVNESLGVLSKSNDANRGQVTEYISLLNKNSQGLVTVVNELSSLVEDAHKVEIEIKKESEKIRDASESIKTVNSVADSISSTGADLKRVSEKLGSISDSNSTAYKEFRDDASAVRKLVQQQNTLNIDFNGIQQASDRVSAVASEARLTQNELQANASRLTQLSDNFSKTYTKYINRLEKLEYNPSFIQRFKSIFKRKN